MVERLYPGVHLSELSFRARPIDGVATSPAPADATAPETPPDWTQHSGHDPGVTLGQLFAFLSESLLFGPSAGLGSMVHAQPGYGIAEGLAVGTHSDDTHVTPGVALSPHGQPISADSSTTALREKKP